MYNPGFSSTSGVEISMTRFNNIEINHATGTVVLGSGVIWDQAYAALNSTGLNIVGGPVPTVWYLSFNNSQRPASYAYYGYCVSWDLPERFLG